MCLSHSYFDSCKLLPHPHYPLARASTGLLCAAVKTASVVKNLDLTSFCWWVLIFKLGEMVKGQIPHHPCHGSYICEKTFTRSPSSHLFFSLQTPLFLSEKQFPSVYPLSLLFSWHFLRRWTNNRDNNKTQMFAMCFMKGRGISLEMFSV